MGPHETANCNSFAASIPTDTDIRLTRLFDAPQNRVFDAMTRPEHIVHWWGRLGAGYAVPVCEVDLRVGGRWKFVSRTPTGDMATFYGEYREVSRPERLVFTEIYEPFPDAPSVVTAVFTEEGNKTRLVVTASYPSREVRDMVRSTGMEKGAATSYDRLEDLLARLRE